MQGQGAAVPRSPTEKPENGGGERPGRPPRTERFLYVIGAGQTDNPTKIGVASNVENRLRELQTGNPQPLKVLFSVELDPEIVRKAEAACHRLLDKCRLYGEWFDAEREIAIRAVNEVLSGRLWERSRESVRRARPQGQPAEQMTFRIAQELREELRKLAERERRSMAWLVEEAVRQFIERQKAKSPQ